MWKTDGEGIIWRAATQTNWRRRARPLQSRNQKVCGYLQVRRVYSDFADCRSVKSSLQLVLQSADLLRHLLYLTSVCNNTASRPYLLVLFLRRATEWDDLFRLVEKLGIFFLQKARSVRMFCRQKTRERESVTRDLLSKSKTQKKQKRWAETTQKQTSPSLLSFFNSSSFFWCRLSSLSSTAVFFSSTLSIVKTALSSGHLWPW